MAFYNLNEALKKKAEGNKKTKNGEVALDDLSRVKVLSPGRQVFKRFIRNRLAIFGSCLLLLMFLLAFLGPVFYPYGQKDIFYKYDARNVNYGLVSNNTSFTGFVIDSSVEVNTNANSMMTTNIKKMNSLGVDSFLYLGQDGYYYQVDRLDNSVFTLSRCDAAEIASFGTNRICVGVFDSIKNSVEYKEADELPAEFNMTAKKACKGNSGEFEYDGKTYEFEKAVGKSYTIYCNNDGFIYKSPADELQPDTGEFEGAAEIATPGVVFDYLGAKYVVEEAADSSTVYRIGEPKLAKVFTTLVIDMVDSSITPSEQFRNEALLAAFDSGEFTADGASYTVKEKDEAIFVFDAAGNEYAEFTNFIIRRYDGTDSMEYELKKSIASAVEEMIEKDGKKIDVTCNLPQQNDVGEYNYDEDGNLKYDETVLHISQRDTGTYVINCDQVIYVIDIFASPSWEHILGTDGDGFDVFARIMNGGRVSLMVGFVVVFLETLLGVIMGGLAGYYGGWVDNIIMRMVDIFYCLPSLPIMIILGTLMDALRMDTYVRLVITMGMLGILGWAGVARLVRGQILSLREQEFMIAAEATGIPVKRRIFKHLIPNVMPQLIVSATMGMGSTILTESTLSYLGLGVKHPLATWGTMINSVSSASAMAHYAYIWIPVGILICLTVIAFNFVGDGLRDAYDPKAKR